MGHQLPKPYLQQVEYLKIAVLFFRLYMRTFSLLSRFIPIWAFAFWTDFRLSILAWNPFVSTSLTNISVNLDFAHFNSPNLARHFSFDFSKISFWYISFAVLPKGLYT